MKTQGGTAKAKSVGPLVNIDMDAIRGRGAILTRYPNAQVTFAVLIDTGGRGFEELLRAPGVKNAFEIGMSGYDGHTPTLQDLRKSFRKKFLFDDVC